MTMSKINTLEKKHFVNCNTTMKKQHHVERNKDLDPTRWYILPKWNELPAFLRIPEVKPYFDILDKHRTELKLKRLFDVTTASVLLVVLALPMGVISIAIKFDSEGPIFYRQERVTTYGKIFRIHKFRTMVQNADQIGSAVTVSDDNRVTRIGAKLRGLRLDELPQLFDVLEGTLSFVGTRPEVVKYVTQYSPEMMATLLMPTGITSEASIRYKDESRLLKNALNVDEVYVNEIMPAKMIWNLKSIREFNFLRDILTMVRTVMVIFGKNNE